MKGEFLKRLQNVFLRGLSMGSRFLLIFTLAKLLEPVDLGLFGLMLATVSFSALAIGADYYTYSHRELLSRPSNQWGDVIQHQIWAQLLIYSVLLPAQFLVFALGLIDWSYVGWFFALLIIEHLGQEINRILIVLNKQLVASWVMFLRLGSWVIIILPVMYFFDEARNLTVLYTAWFIGGGIGVIVGALMVTRTVPSWNDIEIDYKWMLRGLKVGGIFFVATLCHKGLVTFDRYVIEGISSTELLGVYVFYVGLVFGLFALLEPAVFSFLYPKILQHYQKGNKSEFLKSYKELTLSTVFLGLVFSLFLWFFVPYIIDWIDKPIYEAYLESFYILIAVGFVYGLCHIPHYALYAMKGDKWIIGAHISSLLVFFITVWYVQLENAMQRVGLALLIAFIWMFCTKLIGYNSARKTSKLLSVHLA